MRRKPVIGVTGPDRGGWPAWVFTARAIRRAGGKPIRIRPSEPAEDVRLDGLVIGGGADVGAPRGEEEPSKRLSAHELEVKEQARPGGTKLQALVGLVLSPLIWILRRLLGMKRGSGEDPARDSLELALLRQADRCHVPVLGICRGAQLMNVHAGGSLHRDLAAFYAEAPNPWTVLPRKEIQIDPGSQLAVVVRAPTCLVNSLHRHAIDELGEGLRVTARDFAGVVQAIEHDTLPWIGVQWHPEFMPQRPDQQCLFERLVEATAADGSRTVCTGHELLRDLAVAQEERQRIHQAQHG